MKPPGWWKEERKVKKKKRKKERHQKGGGNGVDCVGVILHRAHKTDTSILYHNSESGQWFSFSLSPAPTALTPTSMFII